MWIHFCDLTPNRRLITLLPKVDIQNYEGGWEFPNLKEQNKYVFL